MESQYYYKEEQGINNRVHKDVLKINPNFTLAVDEMVEDSQRVDLFINRLGQKGHKKPKSDKYTRVLPILKENFFDYFNRALKYLNEVAITDGEFLLVTKTVDWFQVFFFSTDPKLKATIIVDFRNSIDDLWLIVEGSTSAKERANARKYGSAIDVQMFKRILALTLKYLYDTDSVEVQLEKFIENFKGLCNGDDTIVPFTDSDKNNNNFIIHQLEKRKEAIETRLIENDQDGPNDRIKLRGELEGIQYALQVIRTS